MKLFPVFRNTNPGFITEVDPTDPFNQFRVSAVWGSFNGTTDTPIIYPAYGTLTLQDLQNILLGGSSN